MKKMTVLGFSVGLMALGSLLLFFLAQSTGSTVFKAVITGAEEVPSVNTMATGDAEFTLSADGLSLNFVLNVSGITDITASHIHLAQPGVIGPVVVPLFTGPKPGAFTGTLAQGTITAANLRGLLAGKPLSALITEINSGNAYVNVHTTANPGGEIRGQIRSVLP